jgi:HEAT repeat protein
MAEGLPRVPVKFAIVGFCLHPDWGVVASTGKDRGFLDQEIFVGSTSPSPGDVVMKWSSVVWFLALAVLFVTLGWFAWNVFESEQRLPPLTDKEQRAIEAEADALTTQGAKGIETLAKEVRDGREEWKIAALRALRNLGPEAAPALDSIIPVLKSKQKGLRMLAVATLEAIGPKAKPALPALIEAAKETKDFDGSVTLGGPSNVAEAALEAVKAIDPEALPQVAETMIPGLLKVVEQGQAESVKDALKLLCALGPQAKSALPRLKKMLPGLPPRSAAGALSVFRSVGEEGMTILVDFLVDPGTTPEIKVAILEEYRWRPENTPSTIRILRDSLESKSAEVRAAALRPLERMRAKELIPRMVELLGDEELLKVGSDSKGEDSYYVARALGNQGKEAVPALIGALEDKSWLVRFQAARALARIGKDARDAVPALEKLLPDPLPMVGNEAAKAMMKTGKGGDKARVHLEKHLQADSDLLFPTLKTIIELGPLGRPFFPAVKRLVLESSQFPIQRDGFAAIERMQADPREIVQIWAKLVTENSWFLTFPPKDEIQLHAKDLQEILPRLLEYLKNPNVNVRRESTEILAAMGPAAREAVPALIKALDDDFDAAHGAMEALGAMGGSARPAVAPLLRKFAAIKDGDMEARYRRETILKSLEGIGPAAVEAVPRLLEWLPDHPRAARVLGKIGPEARTAIAPLEKMYQNEKGYARVWSAFALIKITGRTEPYLASLTEAFQSKDASQRRSCLEALVELGLDARAALPTLIRAMKEKNPNGGKETDFRHEAARALVLFGPAARDAVPDLIDMVKNSYYAAKIAAANTLGAIGPDAKEAIPALLEMAEEDPRYEPIVEKVLAKIRSR